MAERGPKRAPRETKQAPRAANTTPQRPRAARRAQRAVRMQADKHRTAVPMAELLYHDVWYAARLLGHVSLAHSQFWGVGHTSLPKTTSSSRSANTNQKLRQTDRQRDSMTFKCRPRSIRFSLFGPRTSDFGLQPSMKALPRQPVPLLHYHVSITVSFFGCYTAGHLFIDCSHTCFALAQHDYLSSMITPIGEPAL